MLDTSPSLPIIILAGDFNFPGIHWIDGGSQLQPNPAYGHEINLLFLDIIDDYSLEQFVIFPTRDNNILDLVFSSQPMISQISVVPGMSDHEAILFSVNSGVNICGAQNIFISQGKHIDGIKVDMINFQNTFMSCHPYSRSVEDNWNLLNNLYKPHHYQKLVNPGVIYIMI